MVIPSHHPGPCCPMLLGQTPRQTQLRPGLANPQFKVGTKSPEILAKIPHQNCSQKKIMKSSWDGKLSVGGKNSSSNLGFADLGGAYRVPFFTVKHIHICRFTMSRCTKMHQVVVIKRSPKYQTCHAIHFVDVCLYKLYDGEFSTQKNTFLR